MEEDWSAWKQAVADWYGQIAAHDPVLAKRSVAAIATVIDYAAHLEEHAPRRCADVVGVMTVALRLRAAGEHELAAVVWKQAERLTAAIALDEQAAAEAADIPDVVPDDWSK